MLEREDFCWRWALDHDDHVDMLIMAWDLLHLVSGLLLLAEQGEKKKNSYSSQNWYNSSLTCMSISFWNILIAFNFLQSCMIPFNLSLIATKDNIYIQFTPFANSVLRNCKSENFSIWRICHWISLLPPNLWVTSTPACATLMAHQQIYWEIYILFKYIFADIGPRL